MIEVEQLRFAEATGQALTFSVDRHHICGVVDPSGTGKTALLSILAGLSQAFTGDVQVMGRPVQAWGPEFYDRVGVSFAQPEHHLALTGRENLQYFCDRFAVRTHAPDAVMEWVGLREDADRRARTYGLDKLRRLSLARSVLHDPELWIVDAPYAGLAPESHGLVDALIARMQAHGTTILFATQYLDIAQRLSEQVIALDPSPRREDTQGESACAR